MDVARLKLYSLIGEGYKAVLEGRVSSLDEVRERMNQRRNDREHKKLLEESEQEIVDINLK